MPPRKVSIVVKGPLSAKKEKGEARSKAGHLVYLFTWCLCLFVFFGYNINALREFYIISLTVRHAVVLGQTLPRSIRVHRREAHLRSVHLQRLPRLRIPHDDAHLQCFPLRRLRARIYTLLDMSLCMCAFFVHGTV